MSEHQYQLQVVPISSVRPNTSALRDVQRTEVGFEELKASIEKNGIYKSLLVRKAHDDVTGEDFLELIDGLQRYSAAKDLGQTTVPVNIVKSEDDVDVWIKQTAANAIGVATKPADYARQVAKIAAAKPLWTKTELAAAMGMSPSFIDERLKLLKLTAEIQALVNEGKIPLTNAAVLATLPAEEQAAYVQQSITSPAGEFVQVVGNRWKEIRKARLEGRKAAPQGFQPAIYVRKSNQIKEEFENPKAVESVVGGYAAAKNLTSEQVELAKLGWKLAMDWINNADAGSVERQKIEYEARKAEEEAQREKLKKERDEKKKAEAAALVAAGLREAPKAEAVSA